MSQQDDAKKKVAQAVVQFVEPGMTVGIGSGTTAALFIEELGRRVKDGLLVRGICSSSASEELARGQGIEVVTFDQYPVIDLAVDGADEISPGLQLIKGGGGQLLREKIVVSATRRFVVIADSTKLVRQLGEIRLPVEVIPMATPLVKNRLQELGIQPELRNRAGKVFITDEGNYILDCRTGLIDDAATLAEKIRKIIGVVEHGLFLHMASLAVISDGDKTWELDRTSPPTSFDLAS